LTRTGHADPVEDIEPAAASTHGDSGPTLKAPAANQQE
jgi:chromosome partitioning protein